MSRSEPFPSFLQISLFFTVKKVEKNLKFAMASEEQQTFFICSFLDAKIKFLLLFSQRLSKTELTWVFCSSLSI